MVQVNKERMLQEFKDIVAIPSHTLGERPVCDYLKAKLVELGFEVKEDNFWNKYSKRGNCCLWGWQ